MVYVACESVYSLIRRFMHTGCMHMMDLRYVFSDHRHEDR